MRKIWTSSMSKYKKKPFEGAYEYAKGDRVFQLYQLLPTGKRNSLFKPVSYNSWQAAKKDGWSHDQE